MCSGVFPVLLPRGQLGSERVRAEFASGSDLEVVMGSFINFSGRNTSKSPCAAFPEGIKNLALEKVSRLDLGTYLEKVCSACGVASRR